MRWLTKSGCAAGSASHVGASVVGCVITSEELNATGESNVYMAVQRLRPQWLRARPRGQTRLAGAESGVVVYIDATRYGTLNSLQSLAISGIYEIRRYYASEATNRFGTGHVNGAIVIRMSRPNWSAALRRGRHRWAQDPVFLRFTRPGFLLATRIGTTSPVSQPTATGCLGCL